MKADTIRLLAAERCSVAEIAAFLGMDPYRVRWLLKRGGRWPLHHEPKDTQERRLNRLLMRMAA